MFEIRKIICLPKRVAIFIPCRHVPEHRACGQEEVQFKVRIGSTSGRRATKKPTCSEVSFKFLKERILKKLKWSGALLTNISHCYYVLCQRVHHQLFLLIDYIDMREKCNRFN